MFEDSDLLQRETLVLRATSPPDVQFSVLDEMGREIGRVLADGNLVRGNVPTRLVLYDRQHTRLLVVERRGHSSDGTFDIPEYTIVDGLGRPVEDGRRVFTMKIKYGRPWTIKDSTKAEVGSLALARPPEGDYRSGLTLLFTITAEVTPQLRLAVLGFAVNVAEGLSRGPAWIIKGSPKSRGLMAWPGSAPEVLTR